MFNAMFNILISVEFLELILIIYSLIISDTISYNNIEKKTLLSISGYLNWQSMFQNYLFIMMSCKSLYQPFSSKECDSPYKSYKILVLDKTKSSCTWIAK